MNFEAEFDKYAFGEEHPPRSTLWVETAPKSFDIWLGRIVRRLRTHRAIANQIDRKGWNQLRLLGQWSSWHKGRPLLLGEGADRGAWEHVSDEALVELLSFFATTLALQIDWLALIPCADGGVAILLGDGGRDTRDRLVEKLTEACGPRVPPIWGEIEERSGLRKQREENDQRLRRRLARFELPNEHPILAYLDQEEGWQVRKRRANGEEILLHPEVAGWRVHRVEGQDSGARFQIALSPYREEIDAAIALELDGVLFGQGWLYHSSKWGTLMVVEEREGIAFDRAPLRVLEAVADLAVRHRTLSFSPSTCVLLESGEIWISPLSFSHRLVQPFVDQFVQALHESVQEKILSIFASALLQIDRSKMRVTLMPKELEMVERADYFLLPKEHPLQPALAQLLCDPVYFIERASLERVGYEIAPKDRVRDCSQIMVAGHPELPGHLLKSFPLVGDSADHYRYRLSNYLNRLESRDRIQSWIDREGGEGILLPQKWLYKLPEEFSDPSTPKGKYLLVVEKANLLSKEESTEMYSRIDEELLDRLIRIIIEAEVGDIGLHNLPFTRDGRVAFIDTERRSIAHNRFVEEILHFVPDRLHHFVEKRWEEVKVRSS